MGNAFELLAIIVRVTNSVTIYNSMPWIRQDWELHFPLTVGGDLLREFPALSRAIDTDRIKTNLVVSI